MGPTRPESQFETALRAVDPEADTAEEKAEMLMEIAMGMPLRPETPDQLRRTYEVALPWPRGTASRRKRQRQK